MSSGNCCSGGRGRKRAASSASGINVVNAQPVAASEAYKHVFKILLVGDSGVGKSSLVLRYCEDKFRDQHITTIGIDFKVKLVTVDGEKTKLQIWDTAGQERFHTLTTSYYRGAHAIILVYDVAHRKSFENVEKWMRDISKFAAPHIQLVLIGNKSDLVHSRKVKESEGRQQAKVLKMDFFETSAKEDANVDELFMTVAQKVYKERQNDDGWE
mmetsp:Transcript_18166/g.20210  ORF Transcript_18166/g.20210 Transcript_18166/m.20210 type:complete len:213 (-) Transcript_18166:108-746(-)|eukprot:CAMPEP_0168526932 /NCGR_PEP_ID=MMETSP0405-20121227/12284_1 /TAXON_ID=498012 /ORGANISM="Trichosphaerium sp, Strain Am-I-7 wt" /LENGTH=212 /DNA_ID=CAMNT_0008549913 /DNA_START=68 /DNA_END=706 /DNA_ORIENTATION=+